MTDSPEVGAGLPAGLDLDNWQPWTPAQLARRLAGVDVPWWVCGGWALDLWHGRQTREHEDIEFAVCRADFPVVRDVFLADHELYYVGGGVTVPIGPGGMPPDDYTQVWTRDPGSGAFRTDTFLDQGSRDEWICKRDGRLRLPLSEVIAHDAAGVPYQRPEIVLLMKAKHQRAKDAGDLAGAVPLLSPAARRWLVDALELVHPGHDWLPLVRESGPVPPDPR